MGFGQPRLSTSSRVAVWRDGISVHSNKRLCAAMVREERKAWSTTFHPDPLLPSALWPQGYGGPKAWEKQAALLGLLKQQVVLG